MLPQPGRVALRAAADAELNINVKEDGPPYKNTGHAVEIYLASVGLGPGYPWCAAFVSYREITAAHTLGLALPPSFPRGGFAAAAANWADWAQGRGLWIPVGKGTPQKGDLCCFDIASEGGIHHIGIVVGAGNADGFGSVEGNTHAEGDVVRDGYGVFPRDREYSELGHRGGFIRLPW